MVELPVLCCCNPENLVGFLSIFQSQSKPGVHRKPYLPASPNRGQHEFEVRPLEGGGLAVDSGDMPVSGWLQVTGFRPPDYDEHPANAGKWKRWKKEEANV